MKVRFLPSALDDLEWMKRYFEEVFPAGRTGAAKQFAETLENLKTSPKIGQVSEHAPPLRELALKNMPFTLVYQLKEGEILVVRVRDQRSNPL